MNQSRNATISVIQAYRWTGRIWEAIGQALRLRDGLYVPAALSNYGTTLAVVFSDGVDVFYWTNTDGDIRGNRVDEWDWRDYSVKSVALSLDGFVLAFLVCDRPAGRGYVQVYHWSGSMWLQQGSTLRGFSSDDGSSCSPSLSLSGSGRVVAVGEPAGNNVVIYQDNAADWFQIGEALRGEGRFGSSVSLSIDGDMVAIGGEGDSGVVVYRLSPNSADWLRVGRELGGGANSTLSIPTSMSGDGTRVAVSFSNETHSALVRVYDLHLN